MKLHGNAARSTSPISTSKTSVGPVDPRYAGLPAGPAGFLGAAGNWSVRRRREERRHGPLRLYRRSRWSRKLSISRDRRADR